MGTVPKEVSKYLARIGAKGGKVGGKATTKRKADAARANGHKGGRPRKTALLTEEECQQIIGAIPLDSGISKPHARRPKRKG